MTPITKIALEKKIEKGKQCIEYMKIQSQDAMSSNEALLLKLLQQNKNTYYGKKYNFKNIHCAKDYMDTLPLTTYEDYEPYIEEIINGEENPLSVRPVNHFAKSSGTAGNPKKVPMCLEGTEMFTDYTLNVCFATMDAYLGESWVKSRGVSLANIQFEEINGISYGPISGKVREKYKDVEHCIYTSPLIATYPKGDMDTKYLHLRYALMEEDLSFITCSFLNLAVDTMKYLEHNWKVIVEDIKAGTINENIKLPIAERELLLKDLRPMVHRGKTLEKEFLNGFDNILTRIWNNFKFIYGIGGGGFKVYAEKMRKYMGTATLHLSIYSASEGIFATHLAPETHDMVLILDSAFYEFIDITDESSTPITIKDVKKDHNYELILTNLSGFYRYKIKDIVKVTGFLGTCPTIRFLYRQNQMVDMAGEKTNDDCMNTAITNFAKKANFDIVEYSLYADYDHTPGRYVVFVEGENFKGEKDITNLAFMLGLELAIANPSYGDKIRRGILAPLKLHLLRENSFGVYRQLMVAKGASVTQLKPIRLIDNPFREKFFFSMIKE